MAVRKRKTYPIKSAASASVTAVDQTKTKNIEFVLPEITHILPQYYLIRDCLAGEVAVKNAGEKYLPKPNVEDTSIENQQRYVQYIKRAVFYNVSQRTLAGLVGQIFIREPIVKLPSQLDPLIDDVNGMGVTLNQQVKMSCCDVLSYGRLGLYVDYPKTEGPTSVADAESGNISPVINIYKPWDVINWRYIVRGRKKLLSLVVIREMAVVEDDGFQASTALQYRVLTLNAQGVYQVDIYAQGEYAAPKESHIPVDSAGQPMNEIPFMFIGVTQNDFHLDLPPMYDLCSLNIAHYRNSADYEESIYIVGQPTPVFAGLTQEWVNDVLKGRVTLGSRAAVALPVGGTAELLQAEANGMVKEAMDRKERQMVALGAKIVQQSEVQRTATEADQENMAEGSVLSATAQNVAQAYVWALKKANEFVATGTSQEIDYKLNTEFDLVSLAPNEILALLQLWQGNALAFEELRDNLMRAGIASLTVDAAKALIEQEKEADLQRMAEMAEAANPSGAPDGDGPDSETAGTTTVTGTKKPKPKL